MACEKYEELLQAFFDQSLSKDDQRDLKQHLDQCSECRLDFILYKNVFETLDELPDEQAPDISGEILRVVEREPIRPQSAILRLVQPAAARPSLRWALAAAAVVVLAIGAFWGGTSTPTPLPQPLLTAALDTSAARTAPEAAVAAPARDAVKLVVDGDDISVMRRGSETWQPVTGDQQLGLGDRVRTGGDTRALLFYRDSGRLKVLPDTDMQILAHGIRVNQGGTWIKIFKRGTKFQAETPNAVASVRGTVYTVEYDAEALSTRVNLFSSHNPAGGAEVATETEPIRLPEGTYADVVIDEVTRPAAIPLETYLAFNQLPPEEVVTGLPSTATAGDLPAPVDNPLDVEPPVDDARPVVGAPTNVDVPLTSTSVERPPVTPLDKGEFFDSVKNR